MDDREIIELYWQRSQEAIARTDIKYGGMCRGISYSILSSREDSEECVSDTYLTLWQRMPPERPGYLRAFIAAIVRNLSLKCLRSRSSLKRGGGEAALALEELEDCLPAPGRPVIGVIHPHHGSVIHIFDNIRRPVVIPKFGNALPLIG